MNEKASVSKELNEEHRTILQGLLKLPENRECADCKARGPLWASVNLGIFVCMQCSGIHRSLGVHISKVRSVRLDTWLPEQVSFIQTMGNKIANEYWEAELPPNYDRVGIENFIRAKYEDKRWVPRDKKIAPPKPIEPKPETKSDNASKISIKSAEKKSSTNQNFVIPKIPFPFGISSESTVKIESTNHDAPPLAEIDSSDSPPKIIDQTVDLFSGFSVAETSGKDEKVDSLFDDDGWANFESAETTTIEKEKEKTKSSIEDLFYDTSSVTPLPPVPEKTEKNSKDDIMSLFDKSNMASPFAIHQQQQIAYASHQQALLSIYSTGVNTTNNNEINSTEVNEALKTSSPFETPSNSLDEFDFSSLTKDLFSKR